MIKVNLNVPRCYFWNKIDSITIPGNTWLSLVSPWVVARLNSNAK